MLVPLAIDYNHWDPKRLFPVSLISCYLELYVRMWEKEWGWCGVTNKIMRKYLLLLSGNNCFHSHVNSESIFSRNGMPTIICMGSKVFHA